MLSQGGPEACEASSTIRRVESEDWERLRDVRLRALASDPDAFLETVEEARTFPDERWRERARPSDDDVTFVYGQNEAFAGMVSAFVDDNDPETVHLVGMWVEPDLRGSGVARELVERIIEWSRGHGRARVVLSVEAGNRRAARLYEKCGFVDLDTPPPLPYEPHSGTRFYAYTL
jgi:ribosomal protein S18 acetylase RimI-like enzyme